MIHFTCPQTIWEEKSADQQSNFSMSISQVKHRISTVLHIVLGLSVRLCDCPETVPLPDEFLSSCMQRTVLIFGYTIYIPGSNTRRWHKSYPYSEVVGTVMGTPRQ